MNARALEVKKAEVVKFPRELETFSWVNDTYEENQRVAREIRAKQYSRKCRAAKAKYDDLMCVVSGLSIGVIIVAMYFIGVAFM